MSYLDTVRVGEHRPKSPLEDLLPNLGDVKDKDGGGGGDTQEIKSSLPDASFDLQLSTDSNLRFSEGFFNDVFKHVAFLHDVAEMRRGQESGLGSEGEDQRQSRVFRSTTSVRRIRSDSLFEQTTALGTHQHPSQRDIFS